MPKKFLVDGRELICVNEADFDDVRSRFKENVLVDDLEGWNSTEAMEKYTATTFLAKARHYLSLAPPDIMQSAEKAWFAAVYAVKELYLTAGNIDIKSHNGLSFFCDFAIDCSSLSFERRRFLRYSCWGKAEKLHQDVYDSGNFRTSEYSEVICNIEEFVTTFSQLDRAHLFKEFHKSFIASTAPNVDVRKDSGYVKLGGYSYKRDYVVFV
ncbi:unnamed protein product [Caenorhabditis bovis]|uniref:HEPN domain-containing protein n=1 Tax=Caenorhabditis bovis TaxID=2654633 RepID=A0A8S1ESG2_9PELO|nr:unnamed protein product [Caenorhabditis bovis]